MSDSTSFKTYMLKLLDFRIGFCSEAKRVGEEVLQALRREKWKIAKTNEQILTEQYPSDYLDYKKYIK